MKTKLPTNKVTEINHTEAGKRVRSARIKSEMSLRRLAAELGIKPSYLSDLELGRRNWTAERFKKAMSVMLLTTDVEV
jgi:transcriptional regulator with XRE-family HTH domain